MPSSFDAIPLPRKGESFLLRTTSSRRDLAIVVDVGRHARKSEVPKALDAHLRNYMPGLELIDRLILTHEDDDHSGGASQFIAAWVGGGNRIEQVWLPGVWAPASAGPRRSGWIRSRIVKGAFQAAPEIIRALKRLQDEYRDQRNDVSQSTTDLFDDDLLMAALRDAANAESAFAEFFAPVDEPSSGALLDRPLEVEDTEWRYREDLHGDAYLFDDAAALAMANGAFELAVALRERGEIPASMPASESVLALELAHAALQTHEKLSDAIAACALFGLPIRWFDFDEFEKGGAAKGGDPEFLTPVNSVEVRLIPQAVSPKVLLYALSLSAANRECLAYLRHEEGGEPAVLFTGDSRLSTRGNAFPPPNGGLPILRNLLVTAMHHASDQNEPGYAVLRSWLGAKYPPLFVRNGGQGVKKAAKSFLVVRNRLCVRCIGSAAPDQALHLDVYGARWRMPRHARHCVCK